jgi:hypothetical protein
VSFYWDDSSYAEAGGHAPGTQESGLKYICMRMDAAKKKQKIEELRAMVDQGIADLESGEFTDYTDETLPQMIDDIRREARSMARRARPRVLTPSAKL